MERLLKDTKVPYVCSVQVVRSVDPLHLPESLEVPYMDKVNKMGERDKVE